MIHTTEQGLTTRVFRRPQEFPVISEWNELYRHCPDVTPFQRPEWLIAWVEAFSPRELVVVELRKDGRLIGLAPLLIYPRGTERVLAFMGGGVSDYLNVLLEPQHQFARFNQAIEVASRAGDWSLLELTDMPAGSSLLRVAELHRYTAEHDRCSVTALPSSSAELLQMFSQRQRANLRNARSRLQRAGGGQVEVATEETLPEFLRELFSLHASRWSLEGESGVLNDEKVQRFHMLSAPRLTAAGCLRLYRLRVKGRTAAVIYALFECQTVFCYLQGFDPEFSFISPGTLLMFSVMEDAVRMGMRRFDFLRGQEAYKQHWRPQTEPTFRITASAADLGRVGKDLVTAA